MPGRRIGSMPPKDWTEQAKADALRLFQQLDSLSLGQIRAFCAANGLPAEDSYANEFRRQAIRLRMADACVQRA